MGPGSQPSSRYHDNFGAVKESDRSYIVSGKTGIVPDMRACEALYTTDTEYECWLRK